MPEEVRQERHSGDPKSSAYGGKMKKDGGGGKYSTGKAGDEEGYAVVDPNDPNYDSEAENGTEEVEDTIFDKIVRGDIPSKKVYEDDVCLAFHDVAPQAPVHILMIPKNRDGMTQLRYAKKKHEELLGHMMLKIGQIAKEQNLAEYRLVVNDGAGAGQTVFHLHLHLLGGREMTWPPG
jgi:histidine triad (HIT) family protein